MTALPPGREDPRTLGCQCDACPLGQLLRERNEWLPVASEDHDSSVVILAEAPGQEEVPEGRPLVGRSGQEVMRALNAVGVYRGDASYANTLRCFPGETRVSASGVQLGFRRWYAGELVTIQTRSGHKLTGTPNHPVFTEQGGVSLGVLKVGDHVLRRRGSDGVPAGDPDVQDAPATLDECFRTLSHLRTAAQWRGRQRVVDFHGDGRDGEVEVVGAHRELTNWLQALGTEELVQRRLPNADVTLPLLPSGDAALMELGGVQDTALRHRSACGSCECLSRLKGGSAHSETVALGSVPEGDSVLHQGAAHNAFVNIQAGGDGLQALPGKVHGENGLGIEDVPTLFPAESHRFGFGPQDPLCQQDAPNARLLGVQLAREFLDRFPSEVALDEIVHIDRRRWAGHVYDLQTEGGWFFAEGILVSNCRPPNNDWKLFHYRYVDKPNSRINAANKRIAKENRTRKERGLPLEPLKALIPQPLDCCRPQLLRQVERTPNIIAAGVTAYYALTGKRKSIRKIRGSFNDYWLMASTETGARYLTPAPEGWVPGNMQGVVFPLGSTFIKHVRILPTLHPAFVLRTPAWRPLFQGDVARFFRWMQGNLKWTPPKIFVAPDERFLRDFLWDPRIGFHTVDCETDGLNVLDLGWTREEQDQGFKWANATLAQRKGVWKPEYAATAKQREKTPLPKVAKVRCVQIGAPDGRCVVIPLRSVDGHTGMERWYPSPVTAARIVQILKDWLTDASRQKVGHNHLYFDNQMLKTEFGIEVQNVTDTMILFRGAASELRRDLYTLGTFLTDVPDWKTGGDDRNVSVRPRSDHELHVYGATDVHVTAAVAPPLVQMVHARGQAQAMFTDHSMSHIAREMYALGIGRVNEPKRAALEEELLEKVTKYRSEIQRLTTPDWNPRSLADLTNLFVEKWGLPILGETPTGEPSWDDATLRAYRQAGVLNPEQTALFDFLRGFRTADKILGTYVRPWRRWNDYRRTSTGKLVGGKVGPDGRLHAHFNVAAPKTGRISSSDPNCFDGETELLTLEHGWIRFAELALRTDRDTVHVAQWSADDGVEFVRPTAWQHHQYRGQMVHLQNQQIDLLVTPDHRCLLEHRRTGAPKVFRAMDYPEDWKQLHAGHWHGGPGLACNIPLLLAVQADGSLTPTASGKWDLHFVFKKVRKAEKLRSVLAAAGVTYTETNPNGSYAFYVHRGQEPVTRIADLIGAEKTFGPWLLQMDRAQADAFCEDIFCWDGSPDRRSMYSSSTPGNASWAATILSLSGHRTKVREYMPPSGRPNWQTDCTWGTAASMTTNIKRAEVAWDGSVYCVSVPSSYVLVRRNGRTCITGQCQNVIEFVRALLEPEYGHLFVGADYDQIELRIVAALARLAGYLGVFKADGDPHAVTSLLIYGEVFRECLELMLDHKPGSAVGGGMSQWEKFTKTGVPEKPTDARESALKFDATDPEKSFQRTARYLREHDGLSWANEDAARKHVAKVHRLSKMYKQLRVFAKTFVYAVIYGGTANTVYQSVSAAEDPKTGKLLFPDMTLKEVRTAYNAFMNNAPELKIWWEQTWEFARRNGYVTECITGYRRDFPEFERNEILNLPVQGAAAKIMTLGMIRLRERVAPGQFGPKTGIVMQVHDFAMVEVPEAQADEMCDTVQSSLTMTFDQLAGVTCSAAAKKAANWMAA